MINNNLLSFLNDNMNTDGKIQQYVQWCLDNSTRIKGKTCFKKKFTEGYKRALIIYQKS